MNTMNTRQMLGLIGSIALFIGVFAPLVSIPIVGSMNYIQNGQADGIFIVIFAVVSLVWVLTKRYEYLWVTGLGSVGVMAFTFFSLQARIADIESELAARLVQLQWGWALLIVGAGLLIACAAMKDKSEEEDTESALPDDHGGQSAERHPQGAEEGPQQLREEEQQPYNHHDK